MSTPRLRVALAPALLIVGTLSISAVAQTRTDLVYATVVQRETSAWTSPGLAEGIVDDCEGTCPCGSAQNNVAYNDSTTAPAKFRWLYAVDFGAVPADLTTGQRVITGVRVNVNGRYNGNDGSNSGSFDIRLIIKDAGGGTVYDSTRLGTQAFGANSECAWRITAPQRDITSAVDWNSHRDWLNNIELHVRRGSFAVNNRRMMVNAFRVVVESDLAPQCSVSSASLPLGVIYENTLMTLYGGFSITNTGGGILQGTVSESCGEFSIQGNASYSLSQGASQFFTVQFGPATAGCGPRSCSLNTGCSQSVLATGAVAANPICSVVQRVADFGFVNVGQSRDVSVAVSNPRSDAITVTASTTCPSYAVTSAPQFQVPAGGSSIVMVRFTPASVDTFVARLLVDCGLCGVGTASLLIGRGTTLVEAEPSVAAAMPAWDMLLPPEPNPSSGLVEVAYAVAAASAVQVDVFDVSGRLVRALVQGQVDAGRHAVLWSGTDDAGKQCAPGKYFVRFRTPRKQFVKAVVLVR